MTALQTANAKIKDLQAVISNLKAKLTFAGGYEDLLAANRALQKEIRRLEAEAEKLKAAQKHGAKQARLAARLPALAEALRDCRKMLKRALRENEKLKDQLESMRNRAKKTSATSDRPSSSNIFRKIFSAREKSGKAPGGQRGHKGRTLGKLPNPTSVAERPPAPKCACGGAVVVCEEKTQSKQIVDIEVAVRVAEERVKIGYCDQCGKKHEGAFSDGYANPANYGNNLKSIVALLNTRMNMPCGKIVETISALTNGAIHMSDGTVVNIVGETARMMEAAIESIKGMLLESGVLLADETGCRVNGKLKWFQIFSTPSLTLYSANEKRSGFLFEGEDLLLLFAGILVHDHLKSYYRYTHLTHAECNEHISRAAKAVFEILKHGWADEMRKFLLDANRQKKELLEKGECFTEQDIKGFFSRFNEILDKGDAEYLAAIDGLQRIARFNDEKCLLKRLREYAAEHLRFLACPEVPRSNNLAEQSAKEVKRKIRVSGGFRSDAGSRNYARIASVISTMRKNGINIYRGIFRIRQGEKLDFSPQPDDSG
jgi:transposase